jgi:hypothetical protein
MGWPMSQDYNEAIQSPATHFADPDLRQGGAVTNALGLPLPCSGNFADVYEVRCPGAGKRWAVKCFTRQVPGLRERYAAIGEHLQRAALGFMVDFQYLPDGIRVGGSWYPVVKMRWVEGLLLNVFVRDNLDKPAMLGALLKIWVRMARRLRAAGVAHGDIQHGNVLLVPRSRGDSLKVRLIDYDGMWVPALAAVKSGEVGHPNYQHPQRLREGTYSPEVDRFPLLVVGVALCCLQVGGRALWERYDNGDNLLFTQADFADPHHSALFAELLQLPDAQARTAAARLMAACQKALEQTPLLDEVFPGTAAAPAASAFPAAPETLPGPAPPASLPAPAPPLTHLAPPGAPPPPVRRAAAPDPSQATPEEAPDHGQRKPDRRKKVAVVLVLGAAFLLAVVVIVLFIKAALSEQSRNAAAGAAPVVPDNLGKNGRPQPAQKGDGGNGGKKEKDRQVPKPAKPEPDAIAENGPAPAAPGAEGPPKLYLSDVGGFDWKGYNGLGKGTTTADEPDLKIRVNGEACRLGLGMHPDHTGSSQVKFRLRGLKARQFTSSVAVNDTAGKGAESPLTFSVLGDGKTLWTSRPVQAPNRMQECRIDVSGINELELRVNCQGGHGGAHAVWLDPCITTGVTKAELDDFLKRKPYPLDLRIVVAIDGKDELFITSSESRWAHREQGPPGPVKMNGVEWNATDKPTWKNGRISELLGREVEDMSAVSMKKIRGRGPVVLRRGKDSVTVVFDDPDPGADTYEVILTFGQ